jgi:cell division protein FtsZ
LTDQEEMMTETNSWQRARIAVIGVGGAGGNAVDHMVQVGIADVDFIAANTDLQALARCEAPRKIVLGGGMTRSLGAGGDPCVGAEAAQRSRQEIGEALQGADLVFVAAGMGGGTGTGAAPVIAEIAQAAGALTIAIVSEPFAFEGSRRSAVAAEGIARLKERVDALIVVPNERLLEMVGRRVPLDIAFRVADEALRQAVQGISELVTRPGLINLDFADVRSLLSGAGQAFISVGYGEGPQKAVEAAHTALRNPLLDGRIIDRAERLLVNITGGEDLTLNEVGQALEVISSAVTPGAEVLFGAVIEGAMEGRAEITLIITGFVPAAQQRVEEPAITDPAWQDLSIPAFLRMRRHTLILEGLNVG